MANMSHELRTPLTGILGIAEILSYEIHGPLNEKQKRNIGIIYSSGQHLLGLINEILDLSKIESGKFELHTELVVINDICQASLDVVLQSAVKKSIQLEFRPDPTPVTILADARRLEQILVNLLSNAVKFTPLGGRVRLEVHSDPGQTQVQFQVIDTGIGIAAEDLPKLFKAFVQIDSRLNRGYEGTGLGLTLVQRLAEMHGGSVSVESKPGAGSCFSVTLPWRQMAAAEQPHVAESVTTASGQAIPAHAADLLGTILLAEDNEINVMTIKDYLEFRGYQISVAGNGLEALQLAEALLPDIILMDLQMPVMDGLESTRQIRANPRLASIPVIALTAMVMAEDIKKCQEAGANEYLSKPINLNQLIEMIERLLKKE
jgi:CheY-like chemotaxis protein